MVSQAAKFIGGYFGPRGAKFQHKRDDFAKTMSFVSKVSFASRSQESVHEGKDKQQKRIRPILSTKLKTKRISVLILKMILQSNLIL